MNRACQPLQPERGDDLARHPQSYRIPSVNPVDLRNHRLGFADRGMRSPRFAPGGLFLSVGPMAVALYMAHSGAPMNRYARRQVSKRRRGPDIRYAEKVRCSIRH
jgi:hypothetical protein